MKIKDLKRYTIQVPPAISDDWLATRTLAEKAERLLRYSVLRHALEGDVRTNEAERELGTALKTLEIQILSATEVQEYKEQFRAAEVKVNREGYWNRTFLPSYNKAIPEFVLEKAIRIKEHLPEAEFYVEHFEKGRPDPFLVVQYKQKEYYIEVWDEPKFEGRKTLK